MKGLILDILSGFFFQCFDDLMQQLKPTENNYQHYFLLLFWVIVAFLFFNHSGESIYIRLISNLFLEGNKFNKSILPRTNHFLSLVLLNYYDNFVKE